MDTSDALALERGTSDRPQAVWAAIERLRRSPILAMSLGSKELFHSNFLAWFAQTFKESADDVFGEWAERDVGRSNPRPSTTVPSEEAAVDLEPAASVVAERETRHLDLIIRMPGREPLVIENKFFSIPTATQLTHYDKVVERHFPGQKVAKLLLTPRLETLARGWKKATYPELANKLRGVVHAVRQAEDGCFLAEIIRRYVELLDDLSVLIDEFGSVRKSESLEISNRTERDSLNRLRLLDGLTKFRASAVALQIKSRLTQMGGPAAGMSIESGLTRKQALLQALVPVHAGPSRGDRIGWQYQGGQFRIVVVAPGHRDRMSAETYVLSRYGSWLSDNALGIFTQVVPSGGHDFRKFRVTGGQRSRGPVAEAGDLTLHGYGTEFVYRPIVGSPLTADDVVRLGVRFTEEAASEVSGFVADAPAAGGR